MKTTPKLGDRVRHRSSGPVMVVIDGGRKVVARWWSFADANFKMATFMADELDILEDSK